MEVMIPLFLLIALVLLALRFGADSRDGFQPTTRDMGWAGVARIPAPLDPAPAASPAAGTLESVVGIPRRHAASPYPTLDAIDRARGADQRPFATDSDAAGLERRARDLTARHWSDLVWLTGRIDQSRLDTVCRELERERLARGAQVLVLPEQPRIAS